MINQKKLLAYISLVAVLACLLLSIPIGASTQTVYVIPIKGEIDPGLAKFMERSYQEAEAVKADLVLLDINTPGGRVDAALDIRDIIAGSSLPSAAFVSGKAISAGAFIAISCPRIGMVPGSTMGGAEPRLGNERADEKFVSYWAKEMAAMAEKNSRDSGIALAMTDRDLGYPGLAEKGKLLTLSYKEAEQYGYADYIVDNREEFLAKLGFEGATVVNVEETVAEKLARYVTSPYIAPILLMVGIAGIIIEVFTVGWGIAGSLGLISLSLYFGGNLLAGASGWESILLFIFGLILLVVEGLAPGFGVPGIGGILCVGGSIVLAAPSWETGIISLVFALVGAIVLLLLSFKVLSKRKVWSRLALGYKFSKETGYIPLTRDLAGYLGQEGLAYTTLRPAGTMTLKDGTRLDVVTEGEYISQGDQVVVTRVEGSRIVVRALSGEK